MHCHERRSQPQGLWGAAKTSCTAKKPLRWVSARCNTRRGPPLLLGDPVWGSGSQVFLCVHHTDKQQQTTCGRYHQPPTKLARRQKPRATGQAPKGVHVNLTALVWKGMECMYFIQSFFFHHLHTLRLTSGYERCLLESAAGSGAQFSPTCLSKCTPWMWLLLGAAAHTHTLPFSPNPTQVPIRDVVT